MTMTTSSKIAPATLRATDPGGSTGTCLLVEGDVGAARMRLRSIVVPYEPQQEFLMAVRELASTAYHGRGSPLPAVALFALSQSGKSTAAKEVARTINEASSGDASKYPIAVATLNNDGRPAAVATSILRALGEKRPELGSETIRRERVFNAIEERQLQVLILDEFHRAGRRPTFSPVIAGFIQDLLDAGLCAVAFVGKAEAHEILKACPDLANRLDAPVRMEPLQWASEYDRRLFTKFVAAYDLALVEQGVLRFPVGFADGDMPQLLMEASQGLIGFFCRIVEEAVAAATRQRHDGLTRQDIANAVEDWGVGTGRIDYNPFHDGASS